MIIPGQAGDAQMRRTRPMHSSIINVP